MPYSEYYKKNLEVLRPQMNEQLSALQAAADKQTETLNTIYEGEVADIDSQYADEERRIAVQKYINERDVAETMANMGTTDSGLNRTQQTAVQLSAANNAAKLQRQKQSMVDSLTREMTASLSQIQTDLISNQAAVRQSFDDAARTAAQMQYQEEQDYAKEIEKKRLEEETKRIKEQENAVKVSANIKGNATGTTAAGGHIISTNGGLLNRNYTGSLDDNDVDVIYGDGKITYVDNNSGKKSTFAIGVNPYTGTNNLSDVSSQYFAATEYGTFKNGYQPKGVKGHGAFTGSVGTDVINGNEQNIWQTPDGVYWIWSGEKNKYLLYDINGDGKSDITDLIANKKKAAK